MLIHDIARVIELKFKDFKSSFTSSSGSASTLNRAHTGFYLNSDMDLFTKIAERIFELGSEEPNGILGARIQLKLRLSNGKVHDCSELFAYDSSTMATSEIIVTLNEDVTRPARRFVNKFKILASLEKYLAIQIDPVAFAVTKNRLY